MGDIAFLEAALARLTDIPITNARLLVHDTGRRGLQALYGKTTLPRRLYPAIRAAVDVSHETQYDGLDNDRDRFTRRMLEMMLTQIDELDAEISIDDINYLMTKLDTFAQQAAY